MMRNPLTDFDPAWLAHLTAREREIFAESLNTLVGGESLTEYICRVHPDEPPPKHAAPIIDAIEQARVKPMRVCFDLGPGHAKTTILARSVAWWLSPGQSPGDLCGYVTYSDEQARTKSEVIRSSLSQSGGSLLEAGTKYKGGLNHWKTPQGGGLLAKGAKGGITGKRVPGLLIYDDPYKDVEEARSPTINEAIIRRFKGVAFTRLQGGSIFVMHTRWDQNDLIGYILRELKWDHVHIPTVCVDENVDILGRKNGEAAWPEKYPYELCLERDGKTRKICGHDGHLVEIRETLGEHLWAAMYQGSPRPEGQAVFHEPARFELKDFSWLGKRGVISIDPAATAKTRADWSVAMVMAMSGFGINTETWIVDVLRLQVEIPALVQQILSLQLRYKLMVACEAVGGFKAVPQTLRVLNSKLRVMDVTPNGKDKFTRAQPIAAAWNAGRVYVPLDAPWADGLIRRYRDFTGGGNEIDDEVDAGSQGYNVLFRTAPKITRDDYANSGI